MARDTRHARAKPARRGFPFLFPPPAPGDIHLVVNTDRPRSASWLLPAGAAILIICGFSYALHVRSGKKNIQAAPTSANQTASPSPLAKSSTLDLVGVVNTVDGQPLQNASVFIYTAQPRSGPGFL